MAQNRLKSRVRTMIRNTLAPEAGPGGERSDLDPLIAQIYDRLDIAAINNPDHHTSLAFDLFRRTPVVVESVKDGAAGSGAAARFAAMLREIAGGRSPLTVRDGLEILDMANAFIGITDAHPRANADVGWHFRASSNFAAKGRILYTIIRFFRPRCILEIGTAYGMATAVMLMALERYARDGKVWTIEPEEPQYSLAASRLTRRFRESVECRMGWSHEQIPELCGNGRRFDLVFHDNGHSGKAYIEDFRRFAPGLAPGAIVVYDDIRWFDRGMVSEDPQCHKGWRAVVDDPNIRAAAEIDGNVGIALCA
jgi:predicted O-methyltransferase YrrM